MKKKQKKSMLPVLAVIAVLLAALAAAKLPAIRRDIRAESRAAIRDAVIRTAVECYAVEGAYPSDLRYLEEKYGLTINHQDFIVSYEAFSSNVLPDVQVLVRGEG